MDRVERRRLSRICWGTFRVSCSYGDPSFSITVTKTQWKYIGREEDWEQKELQDGNEDGMTDDGEAVRLTESDDVHVYIHTTDKLRDFSKEEKGELDEGGKEGIVFLDDDEREREALMQAVDQEIFDEEMQNRVPRDSHFSFMNDESGKHVITGDILEELEDEPTEGLDEVPVHPVRGRKSTGPSASSEDTSFLQDARNNLLRRESEQVKQKNHLTYVIDAEHAGRVYGNWVEEDEPGKSGKLQPNSRHHLASLYKNFTRAAEQWKLDRQVTPPVNPDDLLIMLASVQDDQTLYDAVFHEIACQAEVETPARGLLLKSIREKYTKLVGRLPKMLLDVRDDLIDQRARDKQFAEYLISYQAWWRQQQLVMETTEGQNDETSRDILEEYSVLSTQIPLYEDQARQLRDLAMLHSQYRARAERHLQELLVSREQWQDTAYLICRKLIKDQKLVKLTEMHAIHQTWYNAAKRSYRSIRVADQTVTANLRTIQKEFIRSFQTLESRLLEDEVNTVQLLQSVRVAVDRRLFLGLFKKDKMDSLFVRQTRKSLVRWHHALGQISGRFTGDHVSENEAMLERLNEIFKNVISSTMDVYLLRHNREQEISSDHPMSPIHKSAKKMSLFTNVGPDFQRIPPVDADFGGPVCDNTESPLMSPKPDTPIADPIEDLTDNEFEESERLFQHILNRVVDLSAFRHSLPYTELYRLCRSYQVAQKMFESRIRGEKKFTEWVGEMWESLRKSTELSKDEAYFTRSGTKDSFTDFAAGLLDQVHAMLDLVRNDFTESAPTTKSQNIVRRFLMQTNAWCMLSQSAIEANTESILERISILFTSMARSGIELIALVCLATSNAVTEKRLKELLDKQEDSVERLHNFRQSIDGILDDLYRISKMLDKTPKPPELDDPDDDKPAKWHRISEIEETLVAHVDKWRYYAAMSINYAFEVGSAQEKSYLPDSKLTSYSMEALCELNKFDENGNDFPTSLHIITNVPKCLQPSQMRNWDRGDMIEIRCLGEDENVYVKPFRLATVENLARETAPEIIRKFLAVQAELAAEKMATVKANQLLLELERDFALLNMENQTLDSEIQHRQALKDGTAPPSVTLPEVALVELEESASKENPLPPLFRRVEYFPGYADGAAVCDCGVNAPPVTQ
ncbi:hypothetical protein BV898_10115 [Hypsibius exemplaris]|uniref:Uncharacterized protein n=1 Tax=Hypsibius exemplaris TaxID=2072580 RepID=A0A1W0WKJ1_HYPEX|nr:hypothetical protein BV898_10115 [Hypsibius exemplaris]